jgi:rhodanese-related sulfurtransferase
MSLSSILFGTQFQQNHSFKLLTPIEFKLQIENKDVQLVDVRTPQEFISGHITNAKNIDFFSEKFNIEFEMLNKEKPVYVYCRSGNRSRQTVNKLIKMGFIEIYDLEGGYLNWSNH